MGSATQYSAFQFSQFFRFAPVGGSARLHAAHTFVILLFTEEGCLHVQVRTNTVQYYSVSDPTAVLCSKLSRVKFSLVLI